MRKTKKNTPIISAVGSIALIVALLIFSYIMIAIYITAAVLMIITIVLGVRIATGASSSDGLMGIVILFTAAILTLFVFNILYTRSSTGSWRFRWRSFYRILLDHSFPTT